MFLEVSKENDYTKAAFVPSNDFWVVSVLVEYHKLQPEERSIVRKYIKIFYSRPTNQKVKIPKSTH